MAEHRTKKGSSKRTANKHSRGQRTSSNANKRASRGWKFNTGGRSKGAKKK